jgi:imidazolonepropionase
LCESVLPTIAEHQLADAVDVQLDELGFSIQQTARLFETARKLKMAVKVHTDEVSDYGGAAFAAKYGALSADHLEHVSEDGVSAMARAGTVAVLLPGTTYTTRRVQVPPISLFRHYKVPIAIATNCNPGPSPVTSLLLIANMACTLFRLTPEEVLAGMTRNAAAALGMSKTHGTLEPGKAADFVVWDISEPGELAYFMGLNPSVVVVHGGQIVRRA